MNHFREKEKRDVVEFNIAQYMMQHGMSMMAPEDALKKEQQEYIDAKNKQDVAEKQVWGFTILVIIVPPVSAIMWPVCRIVVAVVIIIIIIITIIYTRNPFS